MCVHMEYVNPSIHKIMDIYTATADSTPVSDTIRRVKMPRRHRQGRDEPAAYRIESQILM